MIVTMTTLVFCSPPAAHLTTWSTSSASASLAEKKRKGKKKKEKQTILYSGPHPPDTVHTQATLLDTCNIAKVMILQHILGSKRCLPLQVGNNPPQFNIT